MSIYGEKSRRQPSAGAIGESAGTVLLNVPCESNVAVGDAVRMLATGIARRAIADSVTNSNVLGIAIKKVTATICNVRVAGITEEIYTGLDVTAEYFLSESVDGGITTTPPTGAGEINLTIGQPFSDKRLFVARGRRIELDP